MVAKAHTLGPGSLAIGETGTVKQFGAQLTKTLLSPDVSTDDDLYTLDGSVVEGEDTITWKLSGTLLQDYDLLSLEAWCFLHQGEKLPFVFTPNAAHTQIWHGVCKIRPVAVGGDVKKRNTQDFEFPVIGAPIPDAGP